MKNMLEQTGLASRKWLQAFAGLLAIAALTAWLHPAAADIGFRDGDARFTLAGSWRVEVADPPPGFASYETFTEGGGSVEVNHGPAGPTTSIGTWQRIGPRKFLATISKQVYKTVEVGGELRHQYDGIVKVRRLITLSPDGNELTGMGAVDIYDPAGNVVLRLPPGPFHGQRMRAEPLEQ